ncbi:hypothetical protein Tco_0181588, partial [Tanacetum coccineum]
MSCLPQRTLIQRLSYRLSELRALECLSHYLMTLLGQLVGQAHTPATVDTESEPEEAPSKTEKFEASKPSDTRITSSHSSASSDSTAPLSLDHPLTQTSPTPTPTRVLFHHRTAHMARYRSSYETSTSSSSLPALPSRKRYRGTSELVEDTEDESLDLDTEREGSEDEGLDSEEEGPGSEEEE